jgi:ubiquinone/menaquinone biosynthesis C-methylase UbiE
MGIYARYLLPRIIDHFMSNPAVERRRKMLLEEVSGHVLEIGCGTGLNIPWYTSRVSSLTLTDHNSGMLSDALDRIRVSPLRITVCRSSAESLPFADGTFDSVVSTWTLCSIGDVNRGLDEVSRVLRPSGTFHFLDHGLSPDPGVRLLQKILKPLFLLFGGGCRPDRDIKSLLVSHEFVIRSLETLYLEGMSRTAGYLYTGVAEKTGSSEPSD